MTVVTAAPPERVFAFERCANFRDLGGYRGRDGRSVRWRRLFRSMTPEYMTADDAARAAELGISLVIDLRGPRFQSSGPVGEPPARRVTPGGPHPLVRNPLEAQEYAELPPDEALVRVLDRMAKAYARAAGLIAEQDGPVLVHCRLGKDRTGVFAAVLLKLLGASDAQVVEDYMLSDRYAAAAEALATANEPADQVGTGSRVAREPPSADGMAKVLARLEDAFGGAERYLQMHGLSRRRTRMLIDKLLE